MSTAEIALHQIKLHAAKSKNYDLQSVCSTCENVLYMYRTFSVAVSVAVMLLKKGSVPHLFHTRRVNGSVWRRIFRCRRNLFIPGMSIGEIIVFTGYKIG